MPRMRSFAAVLVAIAAGCIPPTIDLSGKRCDPSGQCATGYACVAGVCVAPQCTAGAVRSCSSNAACAGPTETCGANLEWGECAGAGDGGAPLCSLQLGVCAGSAETCGSNGQWAACTADSYGPNYGTTEVCDGLDNNCNGETDEGVTGPNCPLQKGVCAGSTEACSAEA